MDDKFDVVGDWLDEKTQEFLSNQSMIRKLAKVTPRQLEEEKRALKIKLGLQGDAQLDTAGVELNLEARGHGKLSWNTLRRLIEFLPFFKRLKPPMP